MKIILIDYTVKMRRIQTDMRFDYDEFMDFMGYRESLIEEKVEESTIFHKGAERMSIGSVDLNGKYTNY